MAIDQKELFAISTLLNHTGAGQGDQIEHTSELDLLKSIVAHLDNNDTVDCKLNRNNLPDSLAFPEAVRNNRNLFETSDIWHRLEKLNNLLRSDYTCRRQMLLKRLDCTVESFKWKGNKKHQDEKPLHAKARSLNDQIQEKYDNGRMYLNEEPQVAMSDLLAIRETECDKLLNGVVSTNTIDCQIAYGKQKQGDLISLKQVIIPHVPDRGGRTDEVRPPPKETFGYQRGGGGFRSNRGQRNAGRPKR